MQRKTPRLPYRRRFALVYLFPRSEDTAFIMQLKIALAEEEHNDKRQL
jgi:hypothetical protein